MANKPTASASQLKGDPRYNNKLASKFVNVLMHGGKKSTAYRVFYDAMEIISRRVNGTEPIEVFEQAIKNVQPQVEVRSKRVGGATYQVPMQVTRKRQQALAVRWVLQAVRARSGKPIAEHLAEELIAAFNKEGAAISTRENTHRMAEANKAFAHFAWR